MDQLNIDEIVAKFKDRLSATKEAEKYCEEVIKPLVEKIFLDQFIKAFENIAEAINERVGAEVIKHYIEKDNNKYNIEGMYHKIYFQKSGINTVGNTAYVSIIPIYAWKGVTKHLGPISFSVDLDTNEVSWDLPVESIEVYAKKLFSGFAEDKDFNI